MIDLFTPTYRGVIPVIGYTLVAWMPFAVPVPAAGPWHPEIPPPTAGEFDRRNALEVSPFLTLVRSVGCRSTLSCSMATSEHEVTIVVCGGNTPYPLPVGCFWALRDLQGRDGFVGQNGGICDWNQDGFVDGADYDGFMNAWEGGLPASDYNGDGFLDGIDYDLFENTWGAQGVPEADPVGRVR